MGDNWTISLSNVQRYEDVCSIGIAMSEDTYEREGVNISPWVVDGTKQG